MRVEGRTKKNGDATFRLMFERSADAILLLDPRTNLFEEYNQAALDMLRCTHAELSTLHPAELSPEHQPDGQRSFDKANAMIATAMERGSHRFEWTHQSPHRESFPVEVLLTRLPLGDRSMLVVGWRDLTERNRVEQALREAQRLESVGALAGGIAHDFNNLLTAAVGHVHVARSLVATDHPVTAHLDHVEQAVLRAAELTRQMLAYAGKGRFLVEPIDVGALVGGMTELLRVSISKRARLTCTVDPDLPAIEADRAQVQQVVMNMITNAGEALGEREGTVDIRVTRATLDAAELEREFVGQAVRSGPLVMIEVVDDGAGMSPEVQERIFDPFFSTKRSGRGLGLAALRGILRAHGGGVRIRSRVGAGTTFQVFFPASASAAATASAAPVRTNTARGAGTVLLVDDELNVRTSMRAVLTHLGFTVKEAPGGEEALAIFAHERDEIAWVLLDLTMPRMDGHTTFSRLRELDPSLIVIVTSGWSAADVGDRFAGDPPSAFVAKPFTMHELVAILDDLQLLPLKP